MNTHLILGTGPVWYQFWGFEKWTCSDIEAGSNQIRYPNF